MKVSVVIPTYKASPFIRETLDSIFAQTHSPDEILIVDDCSPDNTVAIIEEIAVCAPVPIRVIRLSKNTGGPSAPMNAGIKAARNEIVVLNDQDDLMTPTRIARHCEGFVRPDVGFNFGWISRIDAEGVSHPGFYLVDPARVIALARAEEGPGIWLLDPARVYEDALCNGALVGASNIALRKSLWESLGGFREDHQICWDYEFFCQATRKCIFAYIDTYLANYRVHGGNLHFVSERLGTEWIALLVRHYANPLWPINRTKMAKVIHGTCLDYGYSLSTQGRPFSAVKYYTKSLCFRMKPLSVGRLIVKAFARSIWDHLIRRKGAMPTRVRK